LKTAINLRKEHIIFYEMHFNLVIAMGNPGVHQGYPYPYPSKPIPIPKGRGLDESGSVLWLQAIEGDFPLPLIPMEIIPSP